MPAPANRPYHHGDLRAALLAAAERILERDGPAALTLRAAARETGVSHAAPVHHFGDLAGLRTALAVSGFDRLRAHLAAAGENGATTPATMAAYLGFARLHPGLFTLLLRTDSLRWSDPALTAAAHATFALLTDGAGGDAARLDPDRLALALARLSLTHGAAILLLDGRLDAFATLAGLSTDALVAAIGRHLP